MDWARAAIQMTACWSACVFLDYPNCLAIMASVATFVAAWNAFCCFKWPDGALLDGGIGSAWAASALALWVQA